MEAKQGAFTPERERRRERERQREREARPGAFIPLQ
jgi:hypothetical protein